MFDQQETYINFQLKNSCEIIKYDLFSPVVYIGGIDVSFVEQGKDLTSFVGVGALVILEYNTLNVVYSDCVEMTIDIPYVPGFLGFREEPFAKLLFNRLMTANPMVCPQIILIDGCGIYHPRRFGSASQIGLSLDIPTIGISKSFLKLEELNESDFIIKDSNDEMRPYELNVISNGELLAVAIYSGTSKHPSCYISIGNRISIKSAIEIVKHCSKFKIPEPIRQADLLSREAVRIKMNK